MNRLRQAAARERQAPIYWWFTLMAATVGALVVGVHRHSPGIAVLLGVLLGGAWLAPLMAMWSLSAPRRALAPPPQPGHGSYSEWMRSARFLGRVLLYHEDNPAFPPELRRSLHRAREDLRDTFRAHPLRDDLERVCQRVREGALQEMKTWLWREHRHRAREIQQEHGKRLAEGMDEDERLISLQIAVEDAAATMTRRCMPRMLERERLTCARDCAWLAAQAVHGQDPSLSPIELAAALVIEWCDFSLPWRPAAVFHRALEWSREAAGTPAAVAAAPAAEAREGTDTRRFRKVRVRVRQGHRHRPSHRSRGPTILEVFLSFGQWLRYSVRAWWSYR